MTTPSTARVRFLKRSDNSVYVNVQDLLRLLNTLSEDSELPFGSRVAYEALSVALKNRVKDNHD